jgi:hypothetical protein
VEIAIVAVRYPYVQSTHIYSNRNQIVFAMVIAGKNRGAKRDFPVVKGHATPRMSA